MSAKRSVAKKDQTIPASNTDHELPAPEIIPATAYKPEVQQAVSEAREVLKDLEPFVIDTDEQAAIVEEVIKAAKARWGALEARRKQIVDPLNAAKDAVQALFKPALNDWAAVEGLAKQKLTARILQLEAAKRAAEAAAEKAFAEGKPAGEVQALVAASAATVTHTAGVSSRKDWVAEVTDANALIRAMLEGKAPANLVVIDNAALQAYAKATKGSAELPGIRFTQKTIVIARG